MKNRESLLSDDFFDSRFYFDGSVASWHCNRHKLYMKIKHLSYILAASSWNEKKKFNGEISDISDIVGDLIFFRIRCARGFLLQYVF